MLIERYFKEVEEVLKKVRNTQYDNIKKASDLISESIIHDGTLYVFGAGHTGMMTEEIVYRAGGLVLVNPILSEGLMLNVRPITKTTVLERLEGVGKVIMERSPIGKKDVVLVASVSGRNAAPVEVAMISKERGAKLIVLTSIEFSKSVESRHSSGKRLFELNHDVILDYCCPSGDATISLEGFPQRIGPVSTISGHYMLNAMIVGVIDNLVKAKIDPLPVFMSANLDGGKEFNNKILERYKDRLFYLR